MDFSAQVAVVGGGHAGVEAALAAARLGLDTVLFTISLDAVANMPCNPSIGGTGKGHLVFEIDALGGEMGACADRVTLQARMLNTGKGAAVRSKRVQADRRRYSDLMKKTLEETPNLRILQAEIADFSCTTLPSGKRKLETLTTSLGDIWHVGAAVFACGTYLGGTIHIGAASVDSGPDGLLAARALSDALRRENIELYRFKTGTPPRVARDSIDFSVLEEQLGDTDQPPFSWRTDRDAYNRKDQHRCHIVYTTAETHRIIRENLALSPLYSGRIHGTGPRYCPSIEDKVVRFADKERHQLFVEPMGEDTSEMYIQGFSTSLPTDVQYKMLRSLPGFEAARITRYAYAIEYDCVNPLQLAPTLEFKEIEGMYGAGQFNGTSGYEEAAAQGLVAGANAALALLGRAPMVLPRTSSYIGTLIDDLVTKGTREPYRIMTSRSEYRLLFRQDNADARLTEIGREAGLVSDAQYDAFLEKSRALEAELRRVKSTVLPPSETVNRVLEAHGTTPLSTGAHLDELLRRPELSYAVLAPVDTSRPPLSPAVLEAAEVTVKYSGYIKRQMDEVKKQKKLEERALPPDLDYGAIAGLRIEAAQKLAAIRPASLGQAARISGVNPADISVLLIYLAAKGQERGGNDD